MQSQLTDLRVRYGPSIEVPYKAVTACYSKKLFTNDTAISNAELQKLFSFIPDIILDRLIIDHIIDVNTALTALIKSFLDLNGALDLEIDIKNGPTDKVMIYAEFINEEPVKIAMDISFAIITFIKSQNTPPPLLKKQIFNAMKNIVLWLPNPIDQKFLNAVKKQKIPYFPINKDASIISYGQGNNSVFHGNANNEFDSNIGYYLQKDKMRTNTILKILGYPTTNQKSAPSLETCRIQIEKMGFPVVIKPPFSRLGQGITANIQSMNQVENAFTYAMKYSHEYVLIEKMAEGIDYLITVSSNKVNGITCNIPPCVIGDGVKSISALIRTENKNRAKNKTLYTSIKPIEIDDIVIQFINNSALTLDDIPHVDELVYLRANSNLATGGTRSIIEEKDVHPDNLAMVINVAKAFRLDSIGVDFITPNILQSWRELGTIIEINSRPILTPKMVYKSVKNQFSEKTTGALTPL